MTGLDQAIRARLDEFCESDMCAEVGKAALLAVLDQLHFLDGIADGIGETRSAILGDTVQRAVDSVRRVIAEKLGVETRDE